MMYKHEIDEHLNRYKAELRLYRRLRRNEYADHVQRRIESWEKIRKKAPEAYRG